MQHLGILKIQNLDQSYLPYFVMTVLESASDDKIAF